MKKTITIAILLVTIIACNKDEEIIEPTYSEILTSEEWNAVNTTTYNDENIEIDREMYSNIEFLFLKNNDIIIYNKTIPENMLKMAIY